MTRSALGYAAAAVLLAASMALSGCAQQPTKPTRAAPTTSSARATPSPTPTPTAPPLPADVLFRLSTVATAPNGATALLIETVHVPVTATATQAADEAQLDTECDGWRSAYTSTKFLVADVITTVTAGSWTPNDVVAADMAGYPVWTGDQRPFRGYCATALPSIPGVARAVSPVGGGPSDSQGGWAIYRYGFSVPTDSSAGATANASTVVLSSCAIQLGAAASASIFASTWSSSIASTSGLSCSVGGT
jgi:hypothetical protein